MQLLLLLLLPVYTYGLLGSKKNVTVAGEFMCGGSPYKGITVELWDDNTLNLDSKLGTTRTDGTGKFKIFGKTREIRDMKPYILAKHNCINGRVDVRCLYTDRFDVPKGHQGSMFNLGKVDLKSATKKRNTKCI
ncbi:unnamed protein product [Litomosoides sigmodontis]|uniref:Transthyretin-like family protein n=1 Tax=Litomosoides sigmodontis TaxID=42156 RepID=A0A3P7K6L0_LITSI|nr:unnamed protein product [Litomosoides sigmodontis]